MKDPQRLPDNGIIIPSEFLPPPDGSQEEVEATFPAEDDGLGGVYGSQSETLTYASIGHARSIVAYEENVKRERFRFTNIIILCILILLLFISIMLVGGILGRLLFPNKPTCCQGGNETTEAPGPLTSTKATNIFFKISVITSKDELNGTDTEDLDSEELDIEDIISEETEVVKADKKKEKDSILVRLPRTVIPTHYDVGLALKTDKVIQGNTTIHLNAEEDHDQIVLNAHGLYVLSVDVKDQISGVPILLQEPPFVLNDTTQLLTIYLMDTVVTGMQYLLNIVHEFETCAAPGINCDAAAPFTIATKLEPTMARTVFPCFDEPDMKATFNISVGLPNADAATEKLDVLANERLCRMSKDTLYTWHHFCATPPMSTYLFAVTIGDFESKCAATRDGLPICVHLPAMWSSSLNNALTTAVRQYDRVTRYFNAIYPLSKLDLVGISFYETAAMENWGLIIHHISSLMTNSATTRRHKREVHLVDRIITHEILHQWFGNMVTMEWWDNIWLNEGFAQFYAHHFAWERDRLMVQTGYYTVLSNLFDIQAHPKNRKPLVQNFQSPEAILRGFQGSGFYHLYVKGSALVKLMMELIGEDRMRHGLSNYIRRASFNNVKRTDLWDALSGVVLNPTYRVSEVMEPWAVQPGLPELHATVAWTEKKLTITQRPAVVQNAREYLDPPTENMDLLWPIPVSHSLNSDPTIMFDSSLQLDLSAMDNQSFVLVNPSLRFPYRVNYDLASWKRLIGQLHFDHETIDDVSRFQLITDARYFLLYNHTTLPLFVNLLSYLEKEDNLYPWVAAIDSIEYLLMTFRNNRDVFASLQDRLRPAVAHLYRLSLRYQSFSTQEFQVLDQKAGQLCKLYCAFDLDVCKNWRPKMDATPHPKSVAGLFKEPSYCGFVYMCYLIQHSNETGVQYVDEAIADLRDNKAEDPGSNSSHTLRNLAPSIMCSQDGQIQRQILAMYTTEKQGAHRIMTMVASPMGLKRVTGLTDSFWEVMNAMPEGKQIQVQKVRLMKPSQVEALISTHGEIDMAKKLLGDRYSTWLDFSKAKLYWATNIQGID